MKHGDKVRFWQDRRPLLEKHGLEATVTAVETSKDGETVQLSVVNPKSGSKYSATAKVATEAAPGVCTALDVVCFPPPAPAGETELPALPADHKRPSVEEFVAAGYKAENYEAHMAEWEQEIRERLAKKEPAPGFVPAAAGSVENTPQHTPAGAGAAPPNAPTDDKDADEADPEG